MHYFGNTGNTQSMIVCTILTLSFWKSSEKLHCGNVDNEPYWYAAYLCLYLLCYSCVCCRVYTVPGKIYRMSHIVILLFSLLKYLKVKTLLLLILLLMIVWTTLIMTAVWTIPTLTTVWINQTLSKCQVCNTQGRINLTLSVQYQWLPTKQTM